MGNTGPAPGPPLDRTPQGNAVASPLKKPRFNQDGSSVLSFPEIKQELARQCVELNAGRDQECSEWAGQLLAAAPLSPRNPGKECTYHASAAGGVYAEGDCTEALKTFPKSLDPGKKYTLTKEDIAKRLEADPDAFPDAPDTSDGSKGTDPGSGPQEDETEKDSGTAGEEVDPPGADNQGESSDGSGPGSASGSGSTSGS